MSSGCYRFFSSGDPTASADDRALCSRRCDAGDLLGIKVLDFVIVGGDRFLSFAAEGLPEDQTTVIVEALRELEVSTSDEPFPPTERRLFVAADSAKRGCVAAPERARLG